MRLPLILPITLLCGAAVLVSAAAPTVTFTDATAAAGLTFVHTSGAFGGKYLPETLGAGCLFLDVDGDGWQDVFFVNSTRWPGHPGAKALPALYRNNHDGTFTNVTRGSGLDVELYGIGGTAADFDNDGKVDLYVTALGGNRLFRNVNYTNLGTFEFLVDVTGRAGVADAGFSTSALWFDYDNDGKLDLFVAHYVDWSIEKDLFCTLDGKAKAMVVLGSRIEAVRWQLQRRLASLDDDGAVLCFGRVSLYTVRGDLQLYIDDMEPQGQGAQRESLNSGCWALAVGR